MKILVGCKLVPEDQDMSVEFNGELNLNKAMPKINPFDLNALQTAVDIKNITNESNICAVSIGGKYLENVKARKDILSRGADELHIACKEEYSNLLPDVSVKIFSQMAKMIGYDLIVCGDGSGDIYSQQTGLRLGALLNIPSINGISKIIEVLDDHMVVQRTLENEIETLKVSLPAVICVSADINTPAIPGMKAIISAGKKPVNSHEINIDDKNLVKFIKTNAAKSKERKHIVIDGDSEEQIDEFIKNIQSIL